MVSGALKILNDGLELVNTNLGTSVIQVGGVLTVIGSLVKMIQTFLLPAIKASVGILGGWGIAIAGVVAGAIALGKAWKDAHPSITEATTLIQENTSKLEANKQRLEELNKLPWYERTTEIQNEVAMLEQENAELEANIEKWQKRQRGSAEKTLKQKVTLTDDWQYQGSYIDKQTGETITTVYGDMEDVAWSLNMTMDELNAAIDEGNVKINKMAASTTYASDEIDEALIRTLTDLAEKLRVDGKLSENDQRLYEQATAAAHDRAEANEILGHSYDSVNDVLREAETAYANAREATEKLANSIHITYAASLELQKQYPELSGAIETVNGKIVLNISKLDGLSQQTTSTKIAMMQLIAQHTILSNTSLDLTQQIEALRQLGAQAGLTQAALAGLSGWDAATTEQQIQGLMWEGGYSYEEAQNVIRSEMMNRLMNGVTQPSNVPEISSAAGGGGGGGGSATDATLEAYKQIISLRESELTLMDKQGASEEDQIAKIKEIQDVLHEEAEYLRSIGASQEDINKLSASWWDYQDKIVKLQEESLKKLKEQYQTIADGLEKEASGYTALASIVQDYADEQIDALNKQLEALEETNKELDNQIALEEKLDALARARESKVMVYKDGRFQYVEDLDAVSSAEADLAEFQRNQEREAEKAAIEAEIAVLEEYKNQWGDLTSTYEKEANKQLALEQFHLDAEKTNWDEMLKNAKDYVDGYGALMSRLTTIKTAMEGDGSGLLGLGGLGGGASISGGSGGGGSYDSDIDYAAKIISAVQTGYMGEALAFAKLRDEKIQGEGITGVESTSALLRRLGVTGYGSGTLSSNGGISLVGEHGAELRVMNRGDGVLPADITRNLWQWGSINPQSLSGMVSNQGMNVTIQTLNLPNVSDGAGFVEYVKNNMFGQVMSFVH